MENEGIKEETGISVLRIKLIIREACETYFCSNRNALVEKLKRQAILEATPLIQRFENAARKITPQQMNAVLCIVFDNKPDEDARKDKCTAPKLKEALSIMAQELGSKSSIGTTPRQYTANLLKSLTRETIDQVLESLLPGGMT